MSGKNGAGSPAAQRNTLSINTLKTSLGWIGWGEWQNQLFRIWIGDASSADLWSRIQSEIQDELGDVELEEGDCFPLLKQQLNSYFRGNPMAFTLPEMLYYPSPRTTFQKQVIRQVRAIPAGKTRTYGEVAQLSGSPGAARGVGTVMSSNRFPILIPCHRVVAADGGLGGFTAPGGLGLKQELLELEQSSLSCQLG